MEDQFENCEYIHIHEETVNTVKKSIPSENKLYDLSDLFKIFGIRLG
jgi:ArsR family transcriptional regulator